MILGEPDDLEPNAEQNSSRITLDALFRAAAARRPGSIALVDAPNLADFTDGLPRRLSYAEADRMVSAIAGRLRGLGLPTDAVVGIQLPNAVENILTILGVLRAGLIAAPLPLLWRRADAVAALARVGAKALVTCTRVGDFAHSQSAMRVAAEVFSIRYVCGFGGRQPDGVVPLDDLYTAADLEPVPPLDRAAAAAHLAVISFEVGEYGPTAVARRHLDLLAGGLGVLLESRLQRDAAVLSTIAPASFAGLSMTLVPWLLTGGTLVLHHPFDADILARQQGDEGCGTLVVPAPVAFRLAATGLFAPDRLQTIIAAWSAPQDLADSAAWREVGGSIVDVSIFGEAGLVAARRYEDGQPLPLPHGVIAAPHHSDGATTVAELGISAIGTVALRGPMVPRYAFPPGIARSDQPHFKVGRDGWVDTGYPCSVDPLGKAVGVTGPPHGIVTVGGYRLALADLRTSIGRIDASATLAAMPDPVMGQRLVGTTQDPQAMRRALRAAGINPLVANCFADHEAIASRGEPVLREAMSA